MLGRVVVRCVAGIAAVGLLVACGGGSASEPQGSVSEALVSPALRDLCRTTRRVGEPAAGTAILGVPNHVVVLDPMGGDSPWADSVPEAWRPATLADTEFVACVSGNRPEEFEVCTYEPAGTVTRVRYGVDVSVYEAATGEPVYIETLPMLHIVGADPPPCPPTKEPSLTRLEGEHVEWPMVESRLTSLVAGEAVSMVTLTLSGGPDAGSYSLPASCSLGAHEPDVWQLEALDDAVTDGLSYFLFHGYDSSGFANLSPLIPDARMAIEVTIGPWREGPTYRVLVASTAEASLGEGSFSIEAHGEAATITFAGTDPSGVGIAGSVYCVRH